jgi:hypothetical protein
MTMNHINHGGSLRALALTTLLSTALATSWATEGPNLLVNGSFEYGDASQLGAGDTVRPGSTAITGWSVAGDSMVWGGPGDVGRASDGISFIDFDGSSRSRISQMVPTLAGHAYRLSFDFGTPNAHSTDPRIGVAVGAGASRFATFHVLNGSGDQVYERFDFDFIADRALTDVVFEELAYSEHADLDNVSLTAMTASVPEPASWVLLAAGLLSIRFARSRVGTARA